MRVGSKVVYLGGRGEPNDSAALTDIKLPSKDEVYTVRRLWHCPTTHRLLLAVNEMVFAVSKACREMGIPAEYFREIDTHPELSETTYDDIMTEIEEMEIQTA